MLVSRLEERDERRGIGAGIDVRVVVMSHVQFNRTTGARKGLVLPIDDPDEPASRRGSISAAGKCIGAAGVALYLVEDSAAGRVRQDYRHPCQFGAAGTVAADRTL